MANLKATTFSDLRRLLGDRHPNQIKIGHNTTAENRADGSILIRLHGHAIVNLFNDGHLRFTLAGRPTVTTRERVNQFIRPVGANVFQENWSQYWQAASSGAPALLDSGEWIELAGGAVR